MGTTTYFKKHPELTSAAAILERPDLFPHPEDPSKGGFHICPPGWNCELSNRNHFRAWGMEAKGWKIVETGSAAGLDGSIAKAAERGELVWLLLVTNINYWKV